MLRAHRDRGHLGVMMHMRGVLPRRWRSAGTPAAVRDQLMNRGFVERSRVIADLDLVCRVVDSGVYDVRISFERGRKLVGAAGAIEVGNPNANHCHVLGEALSGGH